jgi:hypothetical protein
LLGKFAANNIIIDRKFIQLDEELEKVVDLVGQKIDVKFGEFAANFMESMEIEESRRNDLEVKVTSLEGQLEHTLAHVVNLATLTLSIQTRVGELEDMVMVESEDEDVEGDTVVSSSLSDFDLVENMVAIPVPTPSIVHDTLIPIEVLEEFIPPSLHSTPSPPYVQAWEEDPLHDGVPEYRVDPEVNL